MMSNSIKIVGSGINQSGIHPIEYRVLVLPDDAERVTAGGIVIPDAVSDRYQMAEIKVTVVECAPLAFQDMQANITPGDRVIISKYAGILTEGNDGKSYRLVNDKDVLAKLDLVDNVKSEA